MPGRPPRLHALGLLATGLTPLACTQVPRDAMQAPPERPTTSAAATAASSPTAASAPTTPSSLPPRRVMPGTPVPGTQVRVPRHGQAGEPLRIHAPPGTRVSVRGPGGQAPGESETVPASGMLDLATPAQRGRLHLLVERPGATALPFVVELD